MDKDSIRKAIIRTDCSLSDDEIDTWVDDCLKAEKDRKFDFFICQKDIFTQGKKKRKIYHYPKNSVQNYICHYLKERLDHEFKIEYASRKRIINILFDTTKVLNNMNDFVIVRADFKSFFDSVYPTYIFEKYVLPSSISKNDKSILYEYTKCFKYCYAGLCLSNVLTEIACRDFDRIIRAKLTDFGVFFYERYVDDMLLMTSNYISEQDFKTLINSTIEEVFGKCPVKLSVDVGKFSYIARRNLKKNVSFSFLGYDFNILYKQSCLYFEYGISENKRKRYSNIIEQAFIQYSKDNNIELFRQRLKLFSSRVVIAQKALGPTYEWITKGLICYYSELQNYEENMNPDTKKFLNDLYYNLFQKYNLKIPYFFHSDPQDGGGYNLLTNLRKNRTLLFEERIGIPAPVITKWIKRINPCYSEFGKNYYQIVFDYIMLIKKE